MTSQNQLEIDLNTGLVIFKFIFSLPFSNQSEEMQSMKRTCFAVKLFPGL